jgi:hypothetical protein
LDLIINDQYPSLPNSTGVAHQEIFEGLAPFNTPGACSDTLGNHCLPQSLPANPPVEQNSGPPMSNVVPTCFSDPPSGTNYGQVLMKNVCLSQLPYDRWGFYASLNNTPDAKPDPITYSNGAN